MLKNIVLGLFLLLGFSAMAQDADSLFAVKRGKKWSIKYTIKQGENLPMLAKRFYIAEGILEYANDAEDLKKLAPGMSVYIPVTPENYFTVKPTLDANNVRELYYRVGPKDDIALISTFAGVPKTQMREWNGLHGYSLVPDQVMFVGWVRMMAKDSTNSESDAAYPQKKKKAVADTLRPVIVGGGLDSQYNKQTNNGLNVITEKGTAVFFEKPGKNTIYYAFHNATPRGSIIKVFNPGTNKAIYVKVIGPLPDTKLYANSIIGICDAAKEALGVTDSKAWCELTYSPN